MTMPIPTPPPPLPYQTPAVVGFRDRSATLQVVGILFILAGALCGCFMAMTPMALFMPQPGGAPQPRAGDIFAGVVVYAGLCAALVTLGLGCIRKRRWTRPLILVFGWIALTVGAVGMFMWASIAPQMNAAILTAATTPPPPGGGPAPPPIPPAFIKVMVIIITVFMVGIYLVIPAVLLFLFRPDDVRATLEHYDPQRRWTDGVPLGVLGMCALLALGALGALMAAAQGWVAAFGVVMGGAPARLSALAVAIAFAVATWLCFRRRMLGWALAMMLFVLMPLAWATTLLRRDLPQIYLAMGRPEREVRMMQGLSPHSGTWIAAGTAVAGVAVIALGFRVRKYFTSADLQIPETTPQASR